MTRGAHGVLIAVPETAWAKGSVVKEAVPTAAELRAFLEGRFPDARLELVAPGPGRPVTRHSVLAAFEAARPAAGDLFVVLFFGHGLPADDKHPYQSWALTTEEFTDFDLARQLQSLSTGVDTVVISTCCYGRGFYHAGLDSPMVCISAAGDGLESDGTLLRSAAAQLVEEVKAAAERGATYGALAERFGRRRTSGRAFYVDARPPERLDQIVLGTEQYTHDRLEQGVSDSAPVEYGADSSLS